MAKLRQGSNCRLSVCLLQGIFQGDFTVGPSSFEGPLSFIAKLSLRPIHCLNTLQNACTKHQE